MTGKMKSDTIAVHGGYETEPTTRAVAVPIYQTVAYEFESADHGAALFNLEVEGHRYSRISNPTTAVLERRILCSPAWRRDCACRIRGSTTCRKRACSKTAIAC